jgi:hypothetical protein
MLVPKSVDISEVTECFDMDRPVFALVHPIRFAVLKFSTETLDACALAVRRVSYFYRTLN